MGWSASRAEPFDHSTWFARQSKYRLATTPGRALVHVPQSRLSSCRLAELPFPEYKAAVRAFTGDGEPFNEFRSSIIASARSSSLLARQQQAPPSMLCPATVKTEAHHITSIQSLPRLKLPASSAVACLEFRPFPAPDPWPLRAPALPTVAFKRIEPPDGYLRGPVNYRPPPTELQAMSHSTTLPTITCA